MRSAFTTLCFGALIAFGGVAQASIQILPSAPPSVVQGQLESNTAIYGFLESSGNAAGQAVNHVVTGEKLLAQGSDLEPGVVAAPFDSWFFHFDPVGNGSAIGTGSVTFSGNILGIILLDASLDASDGTLGAGIFYPTGIAFRGVELNPGPQIPDSLTVAVGGDLRTIDFHILSAQNAGVEQIRVLVAPGSQVVPEAASIAVWSILGLLGIAGGRHLSRRSAE